MVSCLFIVPLIFGLFPNSNVRVCLFANGWACYYLSLFCTQLLCSSASSTRLLSFSAVRSHRYYGITIYKATYTYYTFQALTITTFSSVFLPSTRCCIFAAATSMWHHFALLRTDKIQLSFLFHRFTVLLIFLHNSLLPQMACHQHAITCAFVTGIHGRCRRLTLLTAF